MGANFNTLTVKGDVAWEDLKVQFEGLQDRQCHEYGHDPYAGHFGVCKGLALTDLTFCDARQAEEYLMENAEKWGPAIAVRYKSDNGAAWLIGAWCAS